jgi:hypothetical protein
VGAENHGVDLFQARGGAPGEQGEAHADGGPAALNDECHHETGGEALEQARGGGAIKVGEPGQQRIAVR